MIKIGLLDLFRKLSGGKITDYDRCAESVEHLNEQIVSQNVGKKDVSQQTTIQKTNVTQLTKKRKTLISTSKDELYVFYYVKRFFPTALHRYQFQSSQGTQYEADVFIPELNVVIEYDGVYWHKDRYARDIEKTDFFNRLGLYVIHIRETGLESLPPFYGFEFWHRVGRGKEGLHTNEYISFMLQDISRFCAPLLAEKLSTYYLTYEQFCDDLPDINSYIYTKTVPNAVSCYSEFKYWNYEKNGNLNPDNVPSDANIKVFLKCPSGKTKHVNVTSVCGSGVRMQFPSTSVDGLCPFWGRPELCNDRCSYYNLQVMKYIDLFVARKRTIDNSFWLRMYALNNDSILGYIFTLFINNKMSKKQFESLVLDGNTHKYLLHTSRLVDISTIETLSLLMQSQRKYNTFDARFDAVQFDTDERCLNALIQYLSSSLANLEPYWRGYFINEMFCLSFQKKLTLSKDCKHSMRKLLKKYPVDGLSPEIRKWLTV